MPAIQSSLYVSMDKSSFKEWSHGKVHYRSTEVRDALAAEIKGGIAQRNGRVFNRQSEFIASSMTWFQPLQRFAYVLGFDSAHKKTLYIYRHQTGLHHHSTCFAGRSVIDAGMMSIVNGRIVYIEHKSGHYKPEFSRVLATLIFLKMAGCDLKKIFVSEPVQPDLTSRRRYFQQALECKDVVLYTAENLMASGNLQSTPHVVSDGGCLSLVLHRCSVRSAPGPTPGDDNHHRFQQFK
ncbi:hypothetical protein D3C77_254300 [compost metagenome]